MVMHNPYVSMYKTKTIFKPVVTPLRRLRQDEHEFKTSVGHSKRLSLKQTKLRSARWSASTGTWNHA